MLFDQTVLDEMGEESLKDVPDDQIISVSIEQILGLEEEK